ncbi:MAG: UvrD-helicase domain-containing protein [Candidatus Alcyoniella australis]|nr:UvrD-helicase domain-containing protein [Candidatus Alcyoniella australis]
MKFVADLHIHSKYSRATSGRSDLPNLWLWAQLKGIGVVGTGDFTHPAWSAELAQSLEPAEPGLYKLKRELRAPLESEIPASCRSQVRFMLSSEISTIYKRDGRTRKVHSVILAPDLEDAARISAQLDRIGNIRSDGRPILGLDQRDLLQIVLDCSERAVMIPAHIWTPWFSALGSKSGFECLEDCYGELYKHIFAVETGLSSDPEMNWRLSALDGLTLVSNSDCHSPEKLGREANLFDCELSYDAIIRALRRESGPDQFLGTIEFYPHQGKYHYDGHRKCGVRLDPAQTRECGGLCPECGKPVTVGVLNRIDQLADRELGDRPDQALPYESLIPLSSVIGDALDRGENTKGVRSAYFDVLQKLGPELDVLRSAPIESLRSIDQPLVAAGVDRARRGEVHIDAGYDGEYGTVRLFGPDERQRILKQSALFDIAPKAAASKAKPRPRRPRVKVAAVVGDDPEPADAEPSQERDGLNPEQLAAALIDRGPLLIVAGPGTGKTRTLTRRIARLVNEAIVKPENVLAVTFTNRAADQMRQRLYALLDARDATRLTVCTFHALGLSILRELGDPELSIVGPDARLELIASIEPGLKRSEVRRLAERISLCKARLAEPDQELSRTYQAYDEALRQGRQLDLDDLIVRCVELLRADDAALCVLRERYTSMSVDEYQDVNPAQQALLELLAPPGADLCVIGDPDQAIYGFRGAEQGFIERFEQGYPGTRTVGLVRNYRSSGRIIQASGQVIEAGRGRLAARISGQGPGGTLLVRQACATDRAEAEFVAHSIERLIQGTGFFSIDSGRLEGEQQPDEELGFSDIAVLYRLSALSKPVQQALSRLGVPFQIAGEGSFYERPEIAPLIQRLDKLCHDPQAAQRPACEAIESLAAECVADEPWVGLISRARAMGDLDLRAFCDRAVLSSAADEHDPRAQAVSLMTMHAAKGLEFPVVFIVGCEAGVLPFVREDDGERQLEEERRLLYVAMTRAQHHLYLSYARSRMLFGKRLPGEPSPLIEQIQAELTRCEQRRGKARERCNGGQLELL